MLLCKRASAEEQSEIFRQVHSVWPHDPDPQEHLRLRLASVQHRRADWFVGLLEGEAVCSLGAYPFTMFGPESSYRPARVFGAVFTVPHARGFGYASQLLRWVMQCYAEQAVHDFLLYSDIGVEFYEKLGFQALPSWEWCLPIHLGVGDEDLPFAGAGTQSGSLSGTAFQFGFQRDAELASWIYAKQAQAVQRIEAAAPAKTIDGQPAYLLSRMEESTYILLESNLSQESLDWADFLGWIRADARRRGAHVARGWWTAAAAHPTLAQKEILARDKEILMWRSSRQLMDPWQLLLSHKSFRAYLSEHV